MQIPLWALAIGFLVLYCIWGHTQIRPSQNDYDFGPSIESAFIATTTLIGILAVLAIQGCVGW